MASIRTISVFIGFALVLVPVPALAHEFGVGKGAYEDFLSGNQAVLNDIPVLLGLIAAGLFASIWKADGFPALWPCYAMGLIIGALLGFSGAVAPVLPVYAAVIAVGLLGAAAPNLRVGVTRGMFLLIGIILANAVLSGHSVSEIPPFAYLGIAFALNIGVAISAGLVSVSLEKIPHSWVMIAWRAAMSWLVAITVMTMALMFRSAG
jgi:hypothetical protein